MVSNNDSIDINIILNLYQATNDQFLTRANDMKWRAQDNLVDC
jgi:hypothetical protein